MKPIHILLYLTALWLVALGCNPNPAKPLTSRKSGLFAIQEHRQLTPQGDSLLCTDCGELMIFLQDESLGTHESTIWIKPSAPSLAFLGSSSGGSFFRFQVYEDLVEIEGPSGGLVYLVDNMSANEQTWTSYGGSHRLVLASKTIE